MVKKPFHPSSSRTATRPGTTSPKHFVRSGPDLVSALARHEWSADSEHVIGGHPDLDIGVPVVSAGNPNVKTIKSFARNDNQQKPLAVNFFEE